jgi:hypothetical protein
MASSPSSDERIARMTFATVYPHYVTKVEKKGRTKHELHQVISWLTGFSDAEIAQFIEEKITFATFFERARLHPDATRITGVVCGIRVEHIENPLTRNVRYLDKLVDELAKGKSLEKVLRKG